MRRSGARYPATTGRERLTAPRYSATPGNPSQSWTTKTRHPRRRRRRLGPLLLQLNKEKVILKDIMSKLAASKKRGDPPMYGDPLESGNKARYRFWHELKPQCPLLFEAAWALLVLPYTSTNNERGHSVSGRICEKLRGALKPSTIERLTLAYYFIPEAIKKKIADFAAFLKIVDGYSLDIADVEALLAAEPPPLVRYPRYSFRTRYFDHRADHPYPLPPPSSAPRPTTDTATPLGASPAATRWGGATPRQVHNSPVRGSHYSLSRSRVTLCPTLEAINLNGATSKKNK